MLSFIEAFQSPSQSRSSFGWLASDSTPTSHFIVDTVHTKSQSGHNRICRSKSFGVCHLYKSTHVCGMDATVNVHTSGNKTSGATPPYEIRSIVHPMPRACGTRTQLHGDNQLITRELMCRMRQLVALLVLGNNAFLGAPHLVDFVFFLLGKWGQVGVATSPPYQKQRKAISGYSPFFHFPF